MNLNRLPALAASLANALSSAGARFNHLDRRLRYAGLLAAGTAVVGTAVLANTSAGSSDTAPGVTDPDTVDFRVFPPAGFEGTFLSHVSTRTENGLGSCNMDQETKYQVVNIEGDRATVKYLTSTDYDFRGTTVPNPGADLSRNRLCIQTIDRTGKVLKSEGESPDRLSGGQWPDHPVKVGESWTETGDGLGVNAGRRVTTTVTLREVVMVNDRRMAVLDSRLSGSATGTMTSWIDLETGLEAKTRGKIQFDDATGWPCVSTGSMWLVDSNGSRWVE